MRSWGIYARQRMRLRSIAEDGWGWEHSTFLVFVLIDSIHWIIKLEYSLDYKTRIFNQQEMSLFNLFIIGRPAPHAVPQHDHGHHVRTEPLTLNPDLNPYPNPDLNP